MLMSSPLDDILPALTQTSGDPRQMLALVGRLSEPESMRSLIDLTLSDDERAAKIAAASLRHANGFQKIVLTDGAGPQLRLHIWSPRASDEPNLLENAHNHRWGFATTVLVGAYTVTTFSPTPGDAYLWHRYEPARSKLDYTLTEQGAADLVVLGVATFHGGSSYWTHPSVVHRVSADPDAFTATLLAVAEASSSNTDVFFPRGRSGGVVGQKRHEHISAADLRASLESLGRYLGLS